MMQFDRLCKQLEVDQKIAELRCDERISPQALQDAARTVNEELNR